MSQNISAWFREVIKDKVTFLYQADGGLLDNTMMGGDTQANTVKFPIAGRTEAYKLTGAIERVPVGGPGLSTVQVTMDDFEASDWWRTQDAYKAGPNEQQALAEMIVRAIRRERDKIKLRALAAFAALGGSGVTTIGDGTGTIDIVDVEQARAQIAAAGDTTDEVFFLIPAMWFSQLKFYKEVNDADLVGSNGVWNQRQRTKMRQAQGVTYIEAPDEYIADGSDNTKQYAFMWANNAMGAETPWDQKEPTMSQHHEFQGSPWLVKSMLSGAAIGIQGAGVKRFHFKKLTKPARPVTETRTVA